MPRVRYDGGPEACDVSVEERFGGVEVGVRAQLEARGGEAVRTFWIWTCDVLQDI